MARLSLPAAVACAVLVAAVAVAQDARETDRPAGASAPSAPARTVVLRRLPQTALAVGDHLSEDIAARRLAPAPVSPDPAPLLAGRAPGPFVLVYWSATCPVARRYDTALANLFRDFGGTVRFAILCANDDESDAQVVDAASKAALSVPVLRDSGHAAADRLGVWVTPTALVFDGEGTLRYRGPVDDDRAAMGRETVQHLRDALNALQGGKEVASVEPRAFGSAVRRRAPE